MHNYFSITYKNRVFSLLHFCESIFFEQTTFSLKLKQLSIRNQKAFDNPQIFILQLEIHNFITEPKWLAETLVRLLKLLPHQLRFHLSVDLESKTLGLHKLKTLVLLINQLPYLEPKTLNTRRCLERLSWRS